MDLQPAPGTGKTRLVDHVQLRLGLLKGLSGYFARRLQPDGTLVCRRHRVEHTGKLVYAALIDLALWRYSREIEPLEQAVQRVMLTVDRLGEDPESHVPVFLPGRVDPRNASTNAIDGGACADVLATLLEEVPEAFDDDQRARATAALEQHVEGYLRHAARERPITAQRLWAATGVARAARLMQRDDWAADALAGCRLALEELAPDGVAPYIPAHTDHCTHPGLADTSTFYHSRTPGFVLYVHDILGAELDAFAQERLSASLDALLAFRGGDGRKVLHNEAKAWYWEGAYEVASHPFDVYALHTGARLLERPELTDEAGLAMEEWIAHINPLDGGVDSHHGPGVDFQCRHFWSGHAAWIARVIEDVPVRAKARPPRDVDLAHSGLLHVERPRYVAVLRGATAGHNNLFGCDAGGGTLQSLVVRPDPAVPHGEERAAWPRFRGDRPGSFGVRPAGGRGRLARCVELASTHRRDLKFRLFVASVEWGATRWFGALAYPFRHLLARVWRDATPWFLSHRDTTTTHAYDGHVALFQGGLADSEGRRLDGVTSERRYTFEDEAVLLEDRLVLDGVRGALRYRLPEQLLDVQVESEGCQLKRSGAWLRGRATGGRATVSVRGRWVC